MRSSAIHGFNAFPCSKGPLGVLLGGRYEGREHLDDPGFAKMISWGEHRGKIFGLLGVSIASWFGAYFLRGSRAEVDELDHPAGDQRHHENCKHAHGGTKFDLRLK